jgi:PPOX class probable F420-dependent enzyme
VDEELMRGRVQAARVGRLATVTPDGRPHVVPCCFALDGEAVFSAVDAKPKTTAALRRLRNVRSTPSVALLVDHYEDTDWTRLWWVRVDGSARIVDDGPERDTGIAVLAAKYPMIVIESLTWRAWP